MLYSSRSSEYGPVNKDPVNSPDNEDGTFNKDLIYSPYKELWTLGLLRGGACSCSPCCSACRSFSLAALQTNGQNEKKCACVCVYVYTYEKHTSKYKYVYTCICMCVCICIRISVYRERDLCHAGRVYIYK